MKHLTEQEVNEFKPSYYNPMKVQKFEFDDDSCDEVTIISPCIKNWIVIIDSDGDSEFIRVGSLLSYKSLKQPEKKKLYAYKGEMSFGCCDGIGNGSSGNGHEILHLTDVDLPKINFRSGHYFRAPEYDIEFGDQNDN